MKRFVKIISLVLTLAMVFSTFAVNAMAATAETVPVVIEKEWVDNNNESGKRPVAISVVLKIGEKVVKELDLSENDGWKTQIELPASIDLSTLEVVETTKETDNSLTNYEGSITVVQPSAGGFTIVTPGNKKVHTFNGVKMIVLKMV